MASDVEEHHTQEYQCQIEGLGLEVLLVEEQRTEPEAHHDTAPSDHRHDADHGIRQTQRIEIHEVGCREEQADTQD